MNAEPLRRLRARAIGHTFGTDRSLADAIDRAGFIQADPIRAPARAQDLTLRQRVEGYRAGDLERRYAELDIEEGLLYAYGFLPSGAWSLLRRRGVKPETPLERSVLAEVRRRGPTHPRDLEERLGNDRVENAWGGSSKATTAALDRLQWIGLLRVARRESGIRVYERAPPLGSRPPPAKRYAELVMLVANVLAPVRERTLRSIAARLRRAVPGVDDHRSAIEALVRSGRLERGGCEGGTYLWPPTEDEPPEPPRRVRILAPFDPLVWDRDRFEQLWGWTYRFEAYTPVKKRVRGYYAMPLLWGDAIIGWANAGVTDGKLDVDLGFVRSRPRDRAFRRELDEEIGRLEAFLA